MSDTAVVEPTIERAIFDNPTWVKIRALKPHPQNPRIGDVKTIVESIVVNGQFRRVLVQKSTNTVCAGHHFIKAAKALGWKCVAVDYLNVTDEEALRILIADNEAARKGSINGVKLAEVLTAMPDAAVGTGFTSAEVRALIAGVEDRNEKMIQQILTAPPPIIELPEPNVVELPLDERIEKEKGRIEERQKSRKALLGQSEVEEYEDQSQLDAALAGLQAQFNGIIEQGFETDNYWGIPELREDMLLEKIPDPIDTWARWDATPDDGVTTWIYNYGVTNATKLPWDRTILSFFTWDGKFINWWNDPAYNLARVIHAGCRMAIVPDFSMWGDDPRFLHLQAHYRSMYLGRLFQEAGMKVIPRLHFDDVESLRYACEGIPREAPVVAVCIQAGGGRNPELAHEATETYEAMRTMVKELRPGSILVYGGNPAHRVIEKSNLPEEIPITFVENFAAKRRGTVYDVQRGAAVDEGESDEEQEASTADWDAQQLQLHGPPEDLGFEEDGS